MNKKEKKKAFLFYATTLDTIEELESSPDPADHALAIKLLRAVVDQGLYGEYDDSDPKVRSYMPAIRLGIENAEKRHISSSNGGKKGGSEKLYDDEKIVRLRLQGYTNAQITKIEGCSMKTCQRAWKKYESGELVLGDTTGQNWDITFCRVEETMGQNSDKSDTTILSREGSQGHNMDITATKLVSALQSEATNDDISDKTELSPIDYTKDFVF